MAIIIMIIMSFIIFFAVCLLSGKPLIICPGQAAQQGNFWEAEYLPRNPVLSFASSLAIMLVVFAFNMAGGGLRDGLDPGLRGIL
jgi:ABC-type dipeptide/oligopeptide/nickel transport system permease subunit